MLILRQFIHGLRAGHYRTLLAALIVTIAALTAVGLFTERVSRLMNTESNNLLAADAVLTTDHPISPSATDAAHKHGLQIARTAAFPSMSGAGDAAVLASVKAIDGGYPLRGKLMLGTAAGSQQVSGPPKVGEVWLDPRLATRLNAKAGDTIRLGRSDFRVTALIDKEPDAALDFASLQPRLMMNAADLPATGLIGFGSRVRYRLLVAGPTKDVAAWKAEVNAKLGRGERLEDVREARPEVKTALDRAERFLRLVTLLAATLSAVAILLAARRHAANRADAVALFVTFGASRKQIRGLLLGELLLLFLSAALVGGVVGWGAQNVLGWAIQNQLPAPLAAGSLWPWLSACLFGFVLLVGVAGPSLLQLAATPPLKVLRRELTAPAKLWVSLVLSGGAALGLLWWVAGNATLAALVAGGIIAALLAAGLLGWLLVRAWASFAQDFAARIAVRQLLRRRWLAAAQLAALTVGLLGLWLLTSVENDLLAAWQSKVPVNAPNQFAINIQPDQAKAFTQQLRDIGLGNPALQPMIRGRWVGHNSQPVDLAKLPDDRAKRLAEREFNLSWGETLRADNRIVAGDPLNDDQPGFSVEKGLADTLGIKLGDTLDFDVAGTPVSAKVVNLRQVDWDSFRVNFFVVGTPALFRDAPTSLITSFHLAGTENAKLAQVSRAFPNVTFIDVGAVLAEVRRVLDLVSGALRLVFAFCLAAGITVLLAALETTAPERHREIAVLRALGATRGQIAAILWREGAAIGAAAGLVAGLAASVCGWAIGKYVLELPVAVNWLLPVYSMVTGLLLAAVVTAWERRRLARSTALELIRDPG
ncbi:ABC transporter permease [Andreprevotia chitinilytica]|uniref:ABC transporter permease n=1 Tax=Andreprevotia chitinilytica TaxID=396808 RepID=UPI0005519E53|nr:FtsX-like permease family protein [Andreprevotia chitinilytica]